MKKEKFFEPTKNNAIDTFLEDFSERDMLLQINSTVNTFLDSNPPMVSQSASIATTVKIYGDVYIGANVTIEDYVIIKGPAIILDETYIGQHTLIRGSTIIGYNNIIGHCCEIANSIILNDTTISHYNVITCSLVGSNVNFSAFASTAAFLLKNAKIRELSTPIILHSYNGDTYTANSLKFGSIIGDNCRIGAFSLLNPGVIMERNCIIYPLLNVSSNYYRENSSLYMEGYLAQFIIQIGERAPKPNLKNPSRIKAVKLTDEEERYE